MRELRPHINAPNAERKENKMGKHTLISETISELEEMQLAEDLIRALFNSIKEMNLIYTQAHLQEAMIQLTYAKMAWLEQR